jgi:hypothetical protein
MAGQDIRISDIPSGAKPRRFGPFTSEVSATALLSLIVVMTVLLLGKI